MYSRGGVAKSRRMYVARHASATLATPDE